MKTGRKNKIIKLTHVYHRGINAVALIFSYDCELIEIAKKKLKAKWSNTRRFWYIEERPNAVDDVLKAYRNIAWIDYTGLKGIILRQQVLNDIGVNVLKSYIDELKRRNYSENTIKTYVNLFEKFVRRFNNKPL